MPADWLELTGTSMPALAANRDSAKMVSITYAEIYYQIPRYENIENYDTICHINLPLKFFHSPGQYFFPRINRPSGTSHAWGHRAYWYQKGMWRYFPSGRRVEVKLAFGEFQRFEGEGGYGTCINGILEILYLPSPGRSLSMSL